MCHGRVLSPLTFYEVTLCLQAAGFCRGGVLRGHEAARVALTQLSLNSQGPSPPLPNYGWKLSVVAGLQHLLRDDWC